MTIDHASGAEERFPSISNEIPEAVQRCYDTFNKLARHTTEDGHEWAKNQEARLCGWASSLDVSTKKYEMSIRYRLRLNNSIAAVILQIVEGVEACLSLLLRHCSYPVSMFAFRPGKVEALRRETRQAISRLIEVATYLRTAATQKEDDKALEYDPIDGMGNRLLPEHADYVREQIAMHLRVNRSRYANTQEVVQGTPALIDRENSVETWLSRFEDRGQIHLSCDDFMAERLFRTIIQRWRLLCYRKRRAQLIAENADEIVSGSSPVGTTPKTTNPGIHLPVSALRAVDAVANRFRLTIGAEVRTPAPPFAAPTLSAGRTLPKLAVPSASQAASSATGMTKAALTDLEFPSPPHVEKSGEGLCPLCTVPMSVQHFAGEKWRVHVLRDIRPYICVFEECNNSSVRFNSLRSWRQHMSEQHFEERWVCQVCSCSIDYDSSSTNPDLATHIRGHDATLTDCEIQLIIRHTCSRQPARLRACAFCGGCGAYEMEAPEEHWERLTKHMVEDHMIPLSMLSIPLDLETRKDPDSFARRPVGTADGSTQEMVNSVSLNFSDAISEHSATAGEILTSQNLHFLDIGKEIDVFVEGWLGELAEASTSSRLAKHFPQRPGVHQDDGSDAVPAPGQAVPSLLPEADAVADDPSGPPTTGEIDESGPAAIERPGSPTDSSALPLNRSPWQVYNLLTFDGGGVRGFWSLLVLDYLMRLVAEREESFDDPSSDMHPAFHSFDPMQYQMDPYPTYFTDKERQISTGLKMYDRDHAIRNDSPTKRFLPCHYFDYIGGTSTGGMIAIMLGRLRMTVADCMAEYKSICAEVFGNPRAVHQLVFPYSKRAKFDAGRLNKIWDDIVARRKEEGGNASLPMDRLPSRGLVCRTFVTSNATFPNNPGVTAEHVLRSYHFVERDLPTGQTHIQPPVRRFRAPSSVPSFRTIASFRSIPSYISAPRRTINRGPPADLTISDTARAAMAAPFNFDPVLLKLNGRERVLFEDGGFGQTSNPTMVGIEEIIGMHGRDFLGTVVSIGTARGTKAKSKEHKVTESIQGKLRRVINMATDQNTEHRRAKAFTRDQGVEYFRLDPQQDKYRLEIPLDEWLPRSQGRIKIAKSIPGQHTMEEIERRFRIWALDPDTQAHLSRCAEALVDCRRERTKDRSKWERYATASSFRCRLRHTHHHCGKEFVYRNKFEHHLRTHHNLDTEAIRREVDAAMNKFNYQRARDA